MERARTAAFHLFEVDAAAHVAKEHEHLDGLDVSAGRNHVDGDANAQGRCQAKLADEILGLGGLAGFGVFGLVGNLLAKIIAFAEDLATDVHNVLGMAVVFGKDEGLW